MNDPLQQFTRLQIFDIWQKVKRGEQLEGEEKVIGDLMFQHTDLHKTWDIADRLADKVYNADDTNPFMHIAIDTIVTNQINQGTPIEVRQTYDCLCAKGIDRLEALHAIDRIFIEEFWPVLKYQKQFNQQRYIQKVSKL